MSQVPAGPWPFPAFSPRLFPQMPGPIPRRCPWCIRPLLPRGHRPSPRWNRLGTPQDPSSDFRTGMISGLQSFADVQASGFARHPGRSYRNGSGDPLGSRGFYVRASDGLLPPRPSDMLAVRIGQLTAWGLTPHKTRGLAGRSSNEHPVMARPWPGGEKRIGGRASHHEEPEALGSFLLPYAATGLSLLAVGCRSGTTPQGQPWTSAVTLPHGCNGLSARRMAVLWTFCAPSLCRLVHHELMRSG